MATKKAQPKKAKRERVTLASLDRKIGLIESRLATLNAYETMMASIADAKAAPAEPKEEEVKWVPKVGEYYTATEDLGWYKKGCVYQWAHHAGRTHEPLGMCDRPNSSITFSPEHHCRILRPATPAEIADHKRKMQEAEKKAAEEAEAAKAIGFGTRVKVACREEEVWKVACDEPSDEGYWRLAPRKCGNLNTMTAKRHEFTVID